MYYWFCWSIFIGIAQQWKCVKQQIVSKFGPHFSSNKKVMREWLPEREREKDRSNEKWYFTWSTQCKRQRASSAQRKCTHCWNVWRLAMASPISVYPTKINDTTTIHRYPSPVCVLHTNIPKIRIFVLLRLTVFHSVNGNDMDDDDHDDDFRQMCLFFACMQYDVLFFTATVCQ